MTSAAGKRKKALGRGLEALLPEMGSEGQRGVAAASLRTDEIDSNPYQPRQSWSEEELAALAESIGKSGLIQPLVVRRQDGRYQLIAGERRLRAARLAGLECVPVIIREASEAEMLALALIENIQRKDLGPIEKAEAFRRLSGEFGLTQEQLADAVGLSRSAVANFMRLLELPDSVQQMLRAGSLSMGHGRALLGLDSPATQERLARRIASRGLSVRGTEELVRRSQEGEGPSPARGGKKRRTRSPEVRMLEQRLERRLGTRVRVQDSSGKGRIEIAYSSLDELDRILAVLGIAGDLQT